jgi:hypothetical protein
MGNSACVRHVLLCLWTQIVKDSIDGCRNHKLVMKSVKRPWEADGGWSYGSEHVVGDRPCNVGQF